MAWKPLGYIIAANLLFGILLGGLPSIKLPPWVWCWPFMG
jgi:hypothetical protein